MRHFIVVWIVLLSFIVFDMRLIHASSIVSHDPEQDAISPMFLRGIQEIPLKDPESTPSVNCPAPILSPVNFGLTYAAAIIGGVFIGMCFMYLKCVRPLQDGDNYILHN